MAEHQHTCAHCGAQLPKDSHPLRRYCDSKCARAAEAIRAHAAQPECTCLSCGEAFKPKRSDRKKFCGRSCSNDFIKQRSALFKSLNVSISVQRFKCVSCGESREGSVLRLRCDDCGPERWRWSLSGRKCKCCGSEFTAEYTGGKATDYCSPKCKATAKKASAKAGKAARRARTRGLVAEIIDPIKVFERDGWRCGICGRKTHKGKRGSYHPRAPELDHIIALANGGTHTWRNVQCSCRECNGRKGATDYGQIPLFPAA